MITVKSFDVGEGDMFYINHGADCFTVIDCCVEGVKCTITEPERKAILHEIRTLASEKGVSRFISTHPDEDHIGGIAKVMAELDTSNFYCVRNFATKKDESESFKAYCEYRDSDKAYYVYAGCRRKWLNLNDEGADGDHGCSGINFAWPQTDNVDFKEALVNAAKGVSFNNISPVFTYSIKNSATFMWMGDMEKDFMKKIDGVKDGVKWPAADILFAPHHGRDTGKVPKNILEKISPKLIVIGEAPSDELNYYKGYSTITQLSAKNITFECSDRQVDCYCSNFNYEVEDGVFCDKGCKDADMRHYLGSFAV